MVITETKESPTPVKPQIHIELDDWHEKEAKFEFSETTLFIFFVIASLAGLIYLFIAR